MEPSLHDGRLPQGKDVLVSHKSPATCSENDLIPTYDQVQAFDHYAMGKSNELPAGDNVQSIPQLWHRDKS